MKATGIVRRIDDLGRVVIPKEIRRTMRIREGDPLEIYTDNNGEVIFKKYSPIEELSTFACQYAEVLAKSMGMPVIITDRDHVVAANGIPKREVLERRVSGELEEIMEQRRSYQHSGKEAFKPVEGISRSAAVIYPILSSGDVTGSVILLEGDGGRQASETENKAIQIAADFLGKQMES
ncbi:MAG TPA: AbrB/MazE/SpoVT family DNA-binding domain-containing protein [Firmicutes bacterium]|nr:AbrB/MazE/SpoVT family DNA-binding domain-containing protein [Bacillota bacterium]